MTGKATEWDEFYWHEALDRSHTCTEIIDTILVSHPVIESDERYAAKVEEALMALLELYQMIGDDLTDARKEVMPIEAATSDP